MKKHQRFLRHITAIGILCFAENNGYAQTAKRWNFDFSAATGYWSGDMNYQIGGDVRDMWGGHYEVNDPLSKLEFPFNVMMITANGSISYADLIEARLSYSHNLTDPHTKMKDSDWDNSADPSQLTVFSESDAALTAYAIEGEIKFWLARKYNDKNHLTAAFGPGFAYSYQNLSWLMSNLDQWEPPNPAIPHVIVPGPDLTYDAEVYAPSIGLYGKLKTSWALLEANVGWCFISTHEVDHHLLRSGNRTTITNASGNGVKANLSAKFSLHKNLYLMTNIGLFSFEARGTQHQFNYGEDWTQISNKAKSTQLMSTVGIGYQF